MNVLGYVEEDLIDFPSVINKMIENKILQTINTCFIAKVVEVKEDKANVININKYRFGDSLQDYPILNNVLVGTLHIGNFKVTIPIKKDDLGLCLVCQTDITTFKNTQQGGEPNTERRFDITDSIFIPLQFFNTKSEEDFILKSDSTELLINKDSCIIKSNMVELESNEPLSLKNSQGSLLDLFNDLMSLMDALALSKDSLNAPIKPVEYNAMKSVVENKIKGVLKWV